jgi:hypothetical protein
MNRLQAIKKSNRPKDKNQLFKNVLIKNTFEKLDTHHNGLPRNVICKVQDSKFPKKMYILYIKGHYTSTSVVNMTDYAGFFSDYKDAHFVKKCLNGLFLNIHDDKWVISPGGYTIRVADMNDVIGNVTNHDVYIVESDYTSKNPLSASQYTIENVIALTDNRFEIKNLIAKYKQRVGDFSSWGPVYDKHNDAWIQFEPKIHIKEYYINDVMPTMYITGYDGNKHKEHIRQIRKGLARV